MAINLFGFRHEITLLAFLWLLSWFSFFFVIILLHLFISWSIQHLPDNYLIFISTCIIWVLLNVWLDWYLLWSELLWKISSFKSRLIWRLIVYLSNEWAYLISNKIPFNFFWCWFIVNILSSKFLLANPWSFKLKNWFISFHWINKMRMC